MQVQVEAYDVGVIVGRFQVHELHDAHIDLIQTVCDNHGKVIVFLGLAPVLVTRENPLDFEMRKQMILEKFPDVNVMFIKDVDSDEVWSKKLDEQINNLAPTQSVVLYGSRDSFISHYHGKYPTLELKQERWISGSEIRKSISKRIKSSLLFRAGVIWAAFNQYPKVHPTVDVAIFNDDYSEILLGRKEHEAKFRLIGGFADPKSASYEADARREVQEETGIAISDPQYIGSFIIDDWRYRREVDKIKTLLFTAKKMYGAPRPDDDIAEVRWFKVSDLVRNYEREIVPQHHELIKCALQAGINYKLYNHSPMVEE